MGDHKLKNNQNVNICVGGIFKLFSCVSKYAIFAKPPNDLRVNAVVASYLIHQNYRKVVK